MIFYLISVLLAYFFGVFVGQWMLKRSLTRRLFQELTRKVALREGKKKSVNIAQINEIVKITLQELGLK